MTMTTELEAMLVRLERLEQENAIVRSDNAHERRKLHVQAGLVLVALVAVVFLSPGNRQAIADGHGGTPPGINSRVAALEHKTRYMSADTTAQSTTFSGCNVFVNDGGGTTDTIVANAGGDGLGNLTIGYNAAANDLGSGDIRTGSHNLIIGDLNNYSSYGGMVVGYDNMISYSYASIGGGIGNAANGNFASIGGGIANKVRGDYSSVSGGSNNKAIGVGSSVSGGSFNTASGNYASVSGGGGNKASGYTCSVSGGSTNTASVNYSSISGGIFNAASGDYSSVSGGYVNNALANFSSVSGGHNNKAEGNYSAVSGGSFVNESDPEGWAAGGTGAGTYHSP